MGGGGPSYQPPSAIETGLQTEQAALLRQQREMLAEQMRAQSLLSPYLFREAGVKPIYDAQGRMTGFEEVPDELGGLRKGIEKSFLERSQAALEGKLPVNPALLRDIERRRTTLRERYRRNLGPGFETSTPYEEAQREQEESIEAILEGARRGDLTLAEQLGISRQQATDTQLANMLNRATGAQSYPFAGSGYGSLASLFGQAADPYRADRLARYQAEVARAGQQNQLMGNIFSGVGSIAGGALGRYGLPLLGSPGGGAAGAGAAGSIPMTTATSLPVLPDMAAWSAIPGTAGEVFGGGAGSLFPTGMGIGEEAFGLTGLAGAGGLGASTGATAIGGGLTVGGGEAAVGAMTGMPALGTSGGAGAGAGAGLGMAASLGALALPALAFAVGSSITAKKKGKRLRESAQGFQTISEQLQAAQSPQDMAALLQSYQGQNWGSYGGAMPTLAQGAIQNQLFPGSNLSGATYPWEGAWSRAVTAAGLPYSWNPTSGMGYQYDEAALYDRLIKELGAGTPLTAENYTSWMKAAAPTTPTFADFFAYKAANPWEFDTGK